jgi:carbamoyl-phosphate synthase large subunit
MRKVNILFTSCGRRVELIQSFIDYYNWGQIKGKIICGDLQRSAPAFNLGNASIQLPPIKDNAYMPFIYDCCQKNKINIVIPLLDTELLLFASWREKFKEELDTNLLIPDLKIVEYGMDKSKTYDFFTHCEVAAPEIIDDSVIKTFPVFIKPLFGSASIGARKVNSNEELKFYKMYEKQLLLVQEYISGEEYTIDAWFGLEGEISCIVPRRRFEVRSGEVSKGMTINDESIVNDIMKIANSYKGFRGCVTFQCIKNQSGKNYFIEMNTRFGGGVPLSIAAGANFPKALLDEFIKGEVDPLSLKWKPDFVMLRYDKGIYVTKEEAGF